MDCKKIGEYIQLKRKAIGLTQQDLGDKLGVTCKAVSKWECGVALPDVSLFKELSEILNIEIEELLSGEDNNKEVLVDKKKTIVIVVLLVISFLLLIRCLYLGMFFYKNHDKVHIYDLVSSSNAFRVDGKFIVVDDRKFLAIENIKYNTDSSLSYFDIEYEIRYLDSVLYKSGDIDSKANSSRMSLVKSMSDLQIFLEFEDCDISIEDYLVLKVEFYDENNDYKYYDINIKIK